MQKTMSVRMDDKDYAFLARHAKEHKEEVSKALREIVDLGRLMPTMGRYKKGEVSIGKAAEIAGISISEMISLLAEYRVKSNLEKEDYLNGLENLRKAW